MRFVRAVVVVAIFAVLAFVAVRVFMRPAPRVAGETIGVYYCKTDGETLDKWTVSLSPKARDVTSVAFYATAQAIAGPPPEVSAIRFPAGTFARSVHVSGATVTVDLAGSIAAARGGSFAENGEFKALVWTLTALPGLNAVQVKIDGARVPTLPGGHLELDEPLTRQSW